MYFKCAFYLFFIAIFIGCHSSKRIGQTKRKSSPLLEKYSQLLGTKVSNQKLYESVDHWMGKPYKYAGNDERGIDCSGLVNQLMKQVFQRSVTANSQKLYELSKKIDPSELKEGDLIFFKIDTKQVGHVGFYLANRKFIHSTTQGGVMINSMDEAYYRKYYFAVGRIL